MKRRPLPRPGVPAKAPKGRMVLTHHSPEFLAWCRRHRVKPDWMAACILHTHAKENPGIVKMTIVSKRPIDPRRFLDVERGEA